jgi:hypothetical protein
MRARAIRVQCKLDDMEQKLANQQAYFAQTQLLKFKRRGYAHNPLVLANAMAGLPSIGCRRSSTLCSKWKSHLWPSLRYQIFELIERTWKRRDRGSTAAIVNQVRSSILQLPRTIRANSATKLGGAKKSTEHDNPVRFFFCKEWRYLRLAIEQVGKRRIHPRTVPYIITARFFAKRGRRRDSHEQLLAEVEEIKE